MSAVPAGAVDPRPERRGSSPLRLSLLLATAVLGLLTACHAEDSAPQSLVDGSDAQAPSVELEGVSKPAVLTKVRALRVGHIAAGSRAAECLRGPARGTRPIARVVERVGVTTETVTLRDPSGLRGCDDSLGPREKGRRWCGSSFGLLYEGRLRDPRLDIAGCSGFDGTPIGLAWIEPSRGTRYVAVEQPGYVEVYERAGGLPVRIATSDVHVQGSRATFDISEHDARGELLRRYSLDVVPAG